MKKQWWKETTVYQIYPRSFKDSNGDGNGDINGITSKIDYLKTLGVGAIWLCPIYKSPMIDNGYDVEDYYEVNPMYGTMADMENLIAKADEAGIKIVLDIIPNHTSDQNVWFKKALLNDPQYKDYYIFKDEPIEEITSVFGGKAWSQTEDGRWYLHKFAPQQVDLNWDNPKVREEFRKITDFWIKKGVYGFRFDVIDDIAKNLDSELIKKGENIDIKKLHEYVYEWRNESIWKDFDLLTVGESWDASVEKAILYSDSQRDEFSMVFGFEHISTNWTSEGKWTAKEFNLVDFKKVIQKWQDGLHTNGWNSLFLNNHDLPRLISTFGDDKKYRIESAKAIALTMHLLQGTPYIFQGEEIGMTNCKFLSLEEHNDVEVTQMYATKKGKDWNEEDHLKFVSKYTRDNARTPIQWDGNIGAGFTTGKPWLKINENFKNINVENAINDKNSIFYWYQKLISLRKDAKFKDVIREGKFEIIEMENKNIFAFTRTLNNQKITLISNWSNETVSLSNVNDEGSIVMNNYETFSKDKILPWQSIMITK